MTITHNWNQVVSCDFCQTDQVGDTYNITRHGLPETYILICDVCFAGALKKLEGQKYYLCADDGFPLSSTTYLKKPSNK